MVSGEVNAGERDPMISEDFDMSKDECGELFNAVTHILTGKRVYFRARLRIARAVYDTILAAGQREHDFMECRRRYLKPSFRLKGDDLTGAGRGREG